MIGEAVTAALPLMRAHAASLRSSVCSIDRQDGTTWDEGAQASVPNWVSVAADVPCHVEEPAAVSPSIVTGEAASLEAPVVKVAHDVSGVEPDARVTVVGGPVLWVTRAAPDDFTHPVEVLIQCRWVR